MRRLILLIGFVFVACADDNGENNININPNNGNGCTIESNFSSIHTNLLATSGCASGGCHDSSAAGGLNFALTEAEVHADLVGVASVGGGVLYPDRVTANDSGASFFYAKVAEASPPGDGGRMPVGGSLADCEIEAIEAWIDAGADP